MIRLRILSAEERDASADYVTPTLDVRYRGEIATAVLEYRTQDWTERWEPLEVVDERGT